MRRACHVVFHDRGCEQFSTAVRRARHDGVHLPARGRASAITAHLDDPAHAGRALVDALERLRTPILAGLTAAPVNAPSRTGAAAAVDVAGSPLSTALRWALQAQASPTPPPVLPLDDVAVWYEATEHTQAMQQRARYGAAALQPFVIALTPPASVATAQFEEVPVATAYQLLAAPTEEDLCQRWAAFKHAQTLTATVRLELPRTSRRKRTPSVASAATDTHAAADTVPSCPPTFYWRAFSDSGVFMGYGVPFAALGIQCGRGTPLIDPSRSPFWVPRGLAHLLPHFALPPLLESTRRLHRMSRSQRVRLNLFLAPLFSTTQLCAYRAQIQTALTHAKALRAEAAASSPDAQAVVDSRVEAVLAAVPKVLGEDVGTALERHMVRPPPPPPPALPTPTSSSLAHSGDEEGEEGEDAQEAAFMDVLLGGATSGDHPTGTASNHTRVLPPSSSSSRLTAPVPVDRRVFMSGIASFWSRSACAAHRLPYPFYFPTGLYPYLMALAHRRWRARTRAARAGHVDALRLDQTFAQREPLSDVVLLHNRTSRGLDLADALAVASQTVAHAQHAADTVAHTGTGPSPRRFGALYATTETVLEDVLFAIASELGELTVAEGPDADAPRRMPHYHGPVEKVGPTLSGGMIGEEQEEEGGTIFLLGEAYVNAARLAVGGIVDSTVCAVHGLPLDEQGFPLLRAVQSVRAALQPGGEAFVPSSPPPPPPPAPLLPASAHASPGADLSEMRSYETQWSAFSREQKDVPVGVAAPSDILSTSAGGDMWLRKIHALQGHDTRRHAATSLMRFQSFREKEVAMAQWQVRCRLRYSSAYWLRCDTLQARWGVQHVSGDPISLYGKRYVNAEQTSDASKFTTRTCAPSRTHQVLVTTGLHTCDAVMGQALEALLATVQQERGLGSAFRETRLWIALDLAQRAAWPIPRHATVADVDLEGLNLSLAILDELTQSLAASTRESLTSSAGGSAASDDAPRPRLRLVHAEDIAAREELVFVLTYRPTLLVDKMADLVEADRGYAAYEEATTHLHALESSRPAVSPGTTTAQRAPRAAASEPSKKRTPASRKATAPTTTTTTLTYSAEGGLSVPPTATMTAAALAHARLVQDTRWVEAMATKKRAHILCHTHTTLERRSRIALALLALTKARHDRCPARQVWVSDDFLAAEPLMQPTAVPATTIFLRSPAMKVPSRRLSLAVRHWTDVQWPANESPEALRAAHLRWVTRRF